jgi:TolB-like protein
VDRPSIAALPFAIMSGEAEQEYFADGVSGNREVAGAEQRFAPG